MTVNRRKMLRLLTAPLAAPFLASPLRAQGFAGLGTDAAGFDIPQPGYRFDFPTDHAAHPTFRIEWWYLTANLRDAQGQDYGIQWTLFRSALAPQDPEGWQNPQIWMAHAALTTQTQHHVAEKLARGGIGQAGVTASPFRAWIDDWHMSGPDLDRLHLSTQAENFAYSLTLQADGPLVFHGTNGLSTKSASGQTSYYYSQPHYQITGTLTLPPEPGAEPAPPIPVTGQGWFDREWSSQPLASDQSGWDWFSLSFASGDRLMAFRLRGDTGDFTSGTWITPQGHTLALPNGQLQLDPQDTHTVAGRRLPTRWRLRLPAQQIEGLSTPATDVTIQAINPNSWMEVSFPYWEGPVTVTGSHQGRGYLEMTGY